MHGSVIDTPEPLSIVATLNPRSVFAYSEYIKAAKIHGMAKDLINKSKDAMHEQLLVIAPTTGTRTSNRYSWVTVLQPQ